MKLHQLLKVKFKSKKRVGRGIGSGLGKTAGRGTKGQKARGKIPAIFTGSNSATFKKLPLKRGLGNTKVSGKPKAVKLSSLSVFKTNSVVDMEALIKMNIISQKDSKKGVKILGGGEINAVLTIKLPITGRAAKKIEEKGGKVDNA